MDLPNYAERFGLTNSSVPIGNEQVYPYFYENQLTKSPWVVPISHIHAMKPYRRHGLVTMAIEHRMSRLSPARNDAYAVEVRARAYQHRLTAIQVLNREIENESTRCSDATLAGVIVFLFGDVREQNAVTPMINLTLMACSLWGVQQSLIGVFTSVGLLL